MEVIYLLIPISLLLIGLIITLLFWAIRSGQYDDLEAPKHQIIMDDDDSIPSQQTNADVQTDEHSDAHAHDHVDDDRDDGHASQERTE